MSEKFGLDWMDDRYDYERILLLQFVHSAKNEHEYRQQKKAALQSKMKR